MKLHISVKDLAELSEEALVKHHTAFYPPYFMLQQIDKRLIEPSKEKPTKLEISDDGKLYVYFVNIGKFYALPSIGQMLEYLVKCCDYTVLGDMEQNDPKTWCDLLFEKVKETYK